MYSMIESLLVMNAGALNIQGGWHHIVRMNKEQRAKGKEQRAKRKRFSIFHFLFVIFYLGKRLGVNRGSAGEIENDK
jgi:hypothetical protein